jgi:hypothetical protein
MKTTCRVAASFIIVFVIECCASQPAHYDSKISGSIALGSCQLEKNPIEEPYGSFIKKRTFTLNLTNAGYFREKLFEKISDRLRGHIIVTPSKITAIEKYYAASASPGLKWFTPAEGFIPVIEDISGHMKNSVLSFLNDHVKADNYIVFIGRITDFQMQGLPNGNSLMLSYEIDIAVYTSKGEKIFVRSYKATFDQIKNADITDPNLYYRYLNDAITQNAEKMNEDLSIIIGE